MTKGIITFPEIRGMYKGGTMYTKETLSAINSRYDFPINDLDVAKANGYVELIERTRSTVTPKPGDIFQYLDSFGEYFPNCHIEKEATGLGGNVCEHAYVPFISPREDGISCFASGGPWTDIPFNKMVYVGKAKKRFCDWGSCGARANGAIEFEAEVSVWRYEEPDQKTPGFTTREFNRYFLSDSGEDSRYTRESGYRFHVSTGCYNKRAFKTREDLDAWLTTFRGTVFDRGEKNSAIVWTWKEKQEHPSPEEFDALNLPEDTMLFNGSVRRCKRKYDEANHLVTTYFVWYWPEEGDFCEVAMRQNKIRDERYTLHWSTPEYILARKEMSA